MNGTTTLTVNARTYRRPDRPVVVVCIDGSEPEYHRSAMAAGRMPFLSTMLNNGADLPAHCVMPSFTNPNNLSIATGRPPAVHGICGNFYYDEKAEKEVMMNDPALLRAPTLFAEFAKAGHNVAVVTAKDKLRRLLGQNLLGHPGKAVCFSAEKAAEATEAVNGITDVVDLVGMPVPDVYSAELSEFALAAGVQLLRRDSPERPDLMYLTLTDYIQHKNAPSTRVAQDFYAMMDGYFAQLDALGATLIVTADHGMNRKSDADGEPNVVYLQQHLDAWYPGEASRVLLPITDPYTKHHGALGSYATVYLPERADPAEASRRIGNLPGVALVLERQEAAERFALPTDRIGDLIVVAVRDHALGTAPEGHDLSQLTEPLRSHGGLTEQNIPFLVNAPVSGVPEGHQMHNLDAFWVALNHVDAPRTATAAR